MIWRKLVYRGWELRDQGIMVLGYYGIGVLWYWVMRIKNFGILGLGDFGIG
jgi:hypothetical protein